ncbi:hypothetical protein FBZ94_104147 [Bradyrhizobium sacchari]|uniref:Uncharacterized protein n=1 Tax=Bradyrhizobium sacchari TaxID=1399419 RepID=A0A560INY8_9BRAD|nr:hypothetical protein FBZ94_104147 [Bradyrhizobium sacchari]TWB74266.1 hypothetical protein FBZ95_105519 [Bradyrhizobium sacchari]
MGPVSAAHRKGAALRPGHETVHNFIDFLNSPVTNLGDQWTDLCPKAAAHALP